MKRTDILIDNGKILVKRGNKTFANAFASKEQVNVIKPYLSRTDSFLNRIHVF